MSNLRIPGPTPCPEEVLAEMSRQMINHRGPEFARLMESVTAKLKIICQTKNDVLILTGAGTGGLEAAVVNTLSPRDKVLAISIGVFGDRFASIAQEFGAEVIPLQFEWGKAADPKTVRQALEVNPDIKAVLVTHNETSTGVTNNLEEISTLVNERGKLLLVDAVSSLSSIDLPIDKWHLDVVVSASQKGWMVPPGLAIITMSQKAWQANQNAKMPCFYWDLAKAKSYLEKGQTPWTPAISLFFALDRALDMILQEGLENVFNRHAHIAQKTREGLKAMGIKLFADPEHASNTVTSALIPEGIDGKKLLKTLREKYDIVLSGGQQKLEGKIFRIGHMGWVSDKDIDEALDGLRRALSELRG